MKWKLSSRLSSWCVFLVSWLEGFFGIFVTLSHRMLLRNYDSITTRNDDVNGNVDVVVNQNIGGRFWNCLYFWRQLASVSASFAGNAFRCLWKQKPKTILFENVKHSQLKPLRTRSRVWILPGALLFFLQNGIKIKCPCRSSYFIVWSTAALPIAECRSLAAIKGTAHRLESCPILKVRIVKNQSP